MFKILLLLDCLPPYISQTTQKQLSVIISAVLAMSVAQPMVERAQRNRLSQQAERSQRKSRDQGMEH